jgi:hypothetical protein
MLTATGQRLPNETAGVVNDRALLYFIRFTRERLSDRKRLNLLSSGGTQELSPKQRGETTDLEFLSQVGCEC